MANTNMDPLEALIAKEKAVLSGQPVNSDNTPKSSGGNGLMDMLMDMSIDDDEYGTNDLNNSIKEEENQAQLERERAAMEQKAVAEQQVKYVQPPDPYDKKYQADAIGFQGDKLGIVTGMINRVVAKYKLISGGIPEAVTDVNGTVVLGRLQVMGELTDQYHANGEKITPEFENIILNNWIMPDGTLAINNLSNGIVIDKTMYNGPVVNNPVSNAAEEAPTDEQPKEEQAPTININVEKNSPVTVNVDESVTAQMTQDKVINIHVREVSEKEMQASTIIENSNKPGIISAYDSGINDVPVTLPLSAYRCVLRSINWFDFIKLTAPTSRNSSDNELKRWSVIYNHIKNPSIGDFESFEDFMKKTKYQDRELLMWGLLVATADDEETLSITCGNPKCRKPIKIQYRPRNIVHIDEENPATETWKAAEKATFGVEAYKIWESVNKKRRRYKLPNTGIIAEINEPSAFEFVTEKLPLVNSIFKRYQPDKDMTDVDMNGEDMLEFDYLSANALFISAMTVVRNEDGADKEYRFTNWDDIEKIITTALDAEDSSVLLQIISKSRANVSPVTFRVDDINCPACGRHENYIPIDDIGSTLLFQVSRRLNNTQINLIEMDSN